MNIYSLGILILYFVRWSRPINIHLSSYKHAINMLFQQKPGKWTINMLISPTGEEIHFKYHTYNIRSAKIYYAWDEKELFEDACGGRLPFVLREADDCWPGG